MSLQKVAGVGGKATELKGLLPGEGFGTSVAVSGNTIAVGAAERTGIGRVYVFNKTDMGWHEAAALEGSDISGSTVVVGAYQHSSGNGRAYIFTKAKRDGVKPRS